MKLSISRIRFDLIVCISLPACRTGWPAGRLHSLRMFFNRYVLALALATIMSLAALYLVLTKLDPFADSKLAIILFFLSLFFSISSVSSLMGYILRLLFYPDEIFLNHFNVSLRQGILLGFSVCALMGLQTIRTLTLWNGLMIIFIGVLMEVYFMAKE